MEGRKEGGEREGRRGGVEGRGSGEGRGRRGVCWQLVARQTSSRHQGAGEGKRPRPIPSRGAGGKREDAAEPLLLTLHTTQMG